MDVNKVTLIGRLTQKPEDKKGVSEQRLASFTIATNYIWKDWHTKEKKEQVEFHKVVVWGKLAEIVLTYLDKGSRIYLEGRLKTRKWEDQKKQKRSSTSIIADEIIMLGSKSPDGPRKEEPSEQELVVEEV